MAHFHHVYAKPSDTSPLKLVGMSEPPVAEHEEICRFIYSEDQIFATGRPKPGAFMPMFEKAFKRLEASVCRTATCNDERLWRLGIDIRPHQRLKARAHVGVVVVTDAGLKCLSSPMPGFDEHAVLVAWPIHADPDEEKKMSKQIAMAIARACPPVIIAP